ncbi:MAG: hypothetical protein ACI89X_003447 [Planctomycetota bacterium]
MATKVSAPHPPNIMIKSQLTAALGFGLLASSAMAQVGDPMPEAKFTAFGNSEATTIDDYEGRLILLEVFAYW